MNRAVDIKVEYLYKDALLKSPFHPPTAFSGKLFTSEVPRSWSHDSHDVVQVKPNAIIAELPTLQHLERLYIRRANWLTTEDVETILISCPRLKHVNFRNSGPRNEIGLINRKSMLWATKGDRDKVAELLEKSLRKV